MFEMTWRVNQGGYQWVRTKIEEREQWTLTEVLPYGSEAGFRQYQPLEDFTALWRVFARVTPDKPGIVKFANQYGSLGSPLQLVVDLNGEDVLAEPLSCWMREISGMRLALDLWELARAKKKKEIAKLVRCRPGREIRLAHKDRWGGRGVIVANEQLHPELLRFKPNEVDKLALCAVQNIINAHSRKVVTTSPRVLWVKNFTRLQFYSVTDSLIRALWLQFAQAVGGNAQARQCLQCNKWFEVSLTARRLDSAFCSDACKQKQYRQRKLARELREDGWRLRDIAARLKTDSEGVKGLLKTARK